MQFEVFDLGLIDFQEASEIQKEVFSDVKNGYIQSALIVCRHYPVITLGKQAKRQNILISESELQTKGIQVYAIERGGDVTYHGPGQITVYPIFNLKYLKKDINWFLRSLEDTVINFLLHFGINAVKYSHLTGVWIGKQKIASIGIAIKNWITFHGLSINIKKEDLENFRLIKPCGMDIEMASLETLLNRDIEIDSLKEILIHKFNETFLIEAKSACLLNT